MARTAKPSGWPRAFEVKGLGSHGDPASIMIMGFPKNFGVSFWGPQNRGERRVIIFWESILGSPFFHKLPYINLNPKTQMCTSMPSAGGCPGSAQGLVLKGLLGCC